MELIEKLFRQFDLDEDGKVTAEELVLIFQNLGQNKSEDEEKRYQMMWKQLLASLIQMEMDKYHQQSSYTD